MAVTRLQRRKKCIKKKLVARQKFLKDILKKPTIKRVDVQEVLAGFSKK